MGRITSQLVISIVLDHGRMSR